MQQALIRYYRECYREDNQGKSFLDIFSGQCEFTQFFTESDATILFETGALNLQFSGVDSLHNAIAKWRREKHLLIGQHFCTFTQETCGHFSNNKNRNKRQNLCAPLFLYEAVLEKQDSTFRLTIQPESKRLNYSFLDTFFSGRDYQDELDNALGGLKYNQTLPNLNALFNSLGSRLTLQIEPGWFTGNKDRIAYFEEHGLVQNGLALALFPRSAASRGILDELNTIASRSKQSSALLVFSKPSNNINFYLDQFFGRLSCSHERLPGSLSQAQKRALENAASFPLSLINGPPGCGKSYTIASIALERFMAKESVLIVARSEHAVDVVRDKLVEDLGLNATALVRAGAKDHLKRLKLFIDALAQGQLFHQKEKSWKPQLKAAQKLRKKLQRRLQARMQADTLGRNKAFDRTLSKEFSKLQNLDNEYEALLARYINQIFNNKIHHLANKHRKQLKFFRKALGARSSEYQDKYWENLDFGLLLKALPVWVCSLESLHKALPLKRELFDLVILDEATHCDVASCLPALYRAKRAVVVGDTQQLRHFSFLSRARQHNLMSKFKLEEEQVPVSYRDHSMIDLADQIIERQQKVTLLDEHFRSLPPIIQFSNREFYASRLKLMRQLPGNANERACEIHVCNGKQVGGVNRKEADSVLEKIQSLIQEQSQLPEKYRSSIGVVSFFRAQADYLETLITRRISAEDRLHFKIRAGTAYQFQGEERDIILLSCAVDDTTLSSTMSWLNRPDAFNVAVTRARSRQHVFTSFQMSSLKGDCLLARYLHFLSHTHQDLVHTQPIQDEVLKAFLESCQALGLRSILHYSLAGLKMDIVLEFDKHILAVDLIGFSEGFQAAHSTDDYEFLKRAGVEIFPLSRNEWLTSSTVVLQELKDKVAEIKVHSELKRQSLGSFSHHWTKLLTVDHELAKRVQKLEANCLDLETSHLLDATGEMIDAYLRVLWVLSETLDENELTSLRYKNSALHLLEEGLSHAEKLMRLSKVEIALSLDTQELTEASTLLNEIARKWANYESQNTDTLALALEEMDDLCKRIDAYH